MRVAVTGGSGVVGSALVRHLVTQGHDVTGLARSSEALALIQGLGARAVSGDVLEPESIDRLVGGAERVFHVAGVNEMCSAVPRAMWTVNVTGTQNLVDACRRAGVPRIVHTSSAVTIGQAKGAVGTESTQHRGWYLSEYERSKVAAERIALADTPGPEVIAVNPSSVQGPGRATGTGRIFLAAARGRLPLAVDATVSIVDIDDCARGHILAGETGRPGERYLLSGAVLDVSEGLALLSSMVERKVSPRYVSPGVLTPIATIAGWTARLLRLQAPICAEMVRVLSHGHAYDGTKATRELGLHYTPVEATLARTVDWFRAEGLAP